MVRIIALTECMAACLLTNIASATTVLKVTVEQMTLASHTIVHGVVTASRAETVNGNPKHIRTVVDVEVRQLLRGTRGTRHITLNLPGGRVGDWAMQIPGMPSFTAGEEVVLFLEKTKDNWAISGLSQGKFTVAKAPSGEKLVQRHLDGLHMMQRATDGRLAPVHQAKGQKLQTLSGLLAEVTAYLNKRSEAAK